MADYISPLDFETILVYIFSGTPEMFTFFATIVLSLGAGYFKLPNMVYLTLMALFAIIFSLWIGASLYILVLIIIGFVVFKGIAKLVS